MISRRPYGKINVETFYIQREIGKSVIGDDTEDKKVRGHPTQCPPVK
jgi:hypothetical protein